MSLRLRDLKKKIKKESTLTLKHIYKIQDKYYGTKVGYEVYEHILKEFLSEMLEEMFVNSYVFDLPFNLGYLRIDKVKTKANFDSKGAVKKYGTTYPVDNKRTRELRATGVRKLVYDFDIDYLYKFKWFKGMFPNKTAYYFEPSKSIKTRQYYKSYEEC